MSNIAEIEKAHRAEWLSYLQQNPDKILDDAIQHSIDRLLPLWPSLAAMAVCPPATEGTTKRREQICENYMRGTCREKKCRRIHPGAGEAQSFVGARCENRENVLSAGDKNREIYLYKESFFLDATPRDTPSHFTQNMAGAGASAPADRGPPSPPQTRGGRQEAAPRSLTNKRGANGTGPAEMAPSKKRLKITIDERIATGWQPTGSVWPQLIPGTPGPDEHITSALQLNPFEKALEAALPQARKNLIKWAAECPGESVRFKAENANKIERLAKQTGKAQSAPRAGPFLRSINLTLLDRLSKEAGNPDPLLVRDIAEGMKISGKEGEHPILIPRIKEAVISVEELLKQVRETNSKILKRIKTSGDASLDIACWEKSKEEEKKRAGYRGCAL